MAEEEAKEIDETSRKLQRLIAVALIGVFAVALLSLVSVVVWRGSPDDNLELLKQGMNVLFNVVLLIVGFFFGSSRSSQNKDDANAKMTDKILDKVSPIITGGPLMAKAAKVAAEEAAPAAAKKAAPPVVAEQVPPAVEIAVEEAMQRRE